MSTRVAFAAVAVVLCAFLGVGAAPATATDLSGDAWDAAVLDRLLAATAGDEVALGDARYHRSHIAEARDLLDSGERDPNGASNIGVVFWPNGVVPYNFDGTVSAANRVQTEDALAEWASFADLTFVLRTSQTDYITFHEDPNIVGGNSFVGVKGGQQFLNIGPSSWNRYTLMHESGHALGLEHEQQRSDRDTYVTILTANIIPGTEGNFVKLPNSINYGAYDFLGIMHYARDALSVDPETKNTIVPKAGFTQFLNEIGAQHDRPLSTGDRASMPVNYGAPTPAPSAAVTNTSDSGPGSLRTALQFAFDASETTATTTTVSFNIPTSDPGFDGTTFTIQPTAQLPAFGNRVILNGSTQAFAWGNTNGNGPEIVIDGSQVDSAQQYASGFNMRGSGSKISGLVINGFNLFGVKLYRPTSTGNTVTGCYIGTGPEGTTSVPNAVGGVEIEGGAHGNTVGGSSLGKNILSGNGGEGVRIIDPGTTQNVVSGNTVGLSRTNAVLANDFSGVAIFDGAAGNTVGGTSASAANTISGNGRAGVTIAGEGADRNVVLGNRIGTDTSGSAARPNSHAGVGVFGARDNVIGGKTSGAGNVISGNHFGGVVLAEPGTIQNVIQGNLIGLAANGTSDLGNGDAGITVAGSAVGTQIGGTLALAANTISGNVVGIFIGETGTNSTKVLGNRIGTNKAGTSAVPNDDVGLQVYGGASSTTVGGTAAGTGNVISGNGAGGIYINGTGTTFTRIQGNKIGVNAAGTGALPNGTSGIALFDGATSNFIGGTSAAAANVISANTQYGLTLTDGTTNNVVEGNRIGRFANGNPAPNNAGGLLLASGATGNRIGGTTAGAGNTISNNDGAGVLVLDAATVRNSIRRNSMTANSSLGIDLSGGSENGFAVTVNDNKDPDNGPNKLQNYPVLIAPTTGGGHTTIKGNLNSKPSSTFAIDLFTSPSADPSTFGEGATFLASVTVTTNAAGIASFTYVTNSALAAGLRITATATDIAANTSEFSKRVTSP